MTSPSPSSLFRANLASSISSLRRVRPNRPFWELPAHRIPTLRLFRHLLRSADHAQIRFSVGLHFRLNQHKTGTEQATAALRSGYKWLKAFKSARSGDIKSQEILRRYDSLVAVKRKKAVLEREELEVLNRMRNRPMLTGGLMFPTLWHPALPRMKPQPIKISRMIAKRKRKYENRQVLLLRLKEHLRYAKSEVALEEGLGVSDSEYGGSVREWSHEIGLALDKNQVYFDRMLARANGTVPQQLFERVIQARRNKIANKTRERERERKGEVLMATLRRSRKGPPANVLARMTPQQRKDDRVSRGGIGEIGYLGKVKARIGWRLSRKDEETRTTEDGRTEIWSIEDGAWIDVETEKKLQGIAEELEQENERRRRNSNQV
ncbi:uncharacterized protein BT62DRAFT_900050 [Guyanagaster necrorhizus]|uniref:Uncharacterized protein n=1 Tax=Guyanagaster necrorhizus TaxID=856835 RepID=A0A9P8AQE3_9AGAR|nr:uncharacterized protein BT62DRAFT_900050 [Guyanagaster necrorhizus MCA 3950]KAG7444273.1 hypothetical protein BT62DRAFT_900050 [Guyanagaster necrorhizus MCA 3950]